jgi:hypothetical protein
MIGEIVATCQAYNPPVPKDDFTDIRLPGILGELGDTVRVTVEVIPKEKDEQ